MSDREQHDQNDRAPGDGRARVLVVDDSAFARKVLRESLNASPDLVVVGIARDGLEALEKIIELQPDIVTLDLMMPNLDGIGVLRELLTSASTARVVLVSSTDRDSEMVVEALRLGAFDVVRKPTSLATDVLYGVADDLVKTVVAAARSHRGRTPRAVVGPAPLVPLVPRASHVATLPAHDVELVVIGTSTGGPHALSRVLAGLPADFPACIAIALHIPADYTPALARRLDEECDIAVVEAGDETVLRPGLAVLAKGGMHLAIARHRGTLVARTTAEPSGADYFPSVDLLFESAARATGAGTLGVVLTGMGSDGVRGAHAIAAAGGALVSEAEETCIVYGMPRCVEDAGLSSAVMPIGDVAEELIRRAKRSH